MAWGLLDRFMRPKWLLDRILLVAEDLAESDGNALPALLIATLQAHFEAQYACVHFLRPGMLSDSAREALQASCPAAAAKTLSSAEGAACEQHFWQHALATGKVIAASASPIALQEDLNPLLHAAGVRDAMAVPLTYRGEVYAVACLYFSGTVPGKLATAANVMRSIRLLGNLVYGTLLEDAQGLALRGHESATLALAQAAAARDGYADNHAARVCAMAGALAGATGLSRDEQAAVRLGAVLRDVGKLRVPEYILQKPGPLDAEERAMVREHPVAGARMLAQAWEHSAASGSDLTLALTAVRSHHERLDGSGYPDGLSDSDVPLPARIVAIADVYAALTADRPYRPAWPQAQAVATLREMAVAQLDPDLVALFLERDLHTAGTAPPPAQAEAPSLKSA